MRHVTPVVASPEVAEAAVVVELAAGKVPPAFLAAVLARIPSSRVREISKTKSFLHIEPLNFLTLVLFSLDFFSVLKLCYCFSWRKSRVQMFRETTYRNRFFPIFNNLDLVYLDKVHVTLPCKLLGSSLCIVK